jgi:hypothetical protein
VDHFEDRIKSEALEEEEEKMNPETRRSKRTAKTFQSVVSRAPSRASPEIPILATLAKSPSGLKTKEVLRQVKAHWLQELSETDLAAVYAESKKKVADTIIKYARKHLVEKGELYAPSEDNPIGIWRATAKGMNRALSEQESWKPCYVRVTAVIEIEEEESLREPGNEEN